MIQPSWSGGLLPHHSSLNTILCNQLLLNFGLPHYLYMFNLTYISINNVQQLYKLIYLLYLFNQKDRLLYWLMGAVAGRRARWRQSTWWYGNLVRKAACLFTHGWAVQRVFPQLLESLSSPSSKL